MIELKIIHQLTQKFNNIKHNLNEKTIRQWCAIEAINLGYGGITAVAKATNVSRKTVQRGVKEYNENKFIVRTRIRKNGGGRHIKF